MKSHSGGPDAGIPKPLSWIAARTLFSCESCELIHTTAHLLQVPTSSSPNFGYESDEHSCLGVLCSRVTEPQFCDPRELRHSCHTFCTIVHASLFATSESDQGKSIFFLFPLKVDLPSWNFESPWQLSLEENTDRTCPTAVISNYAHLYCLLHSLSAQSSTKLEHRNSLLATYVVKQIESIASGGIPDTLLTSVIFWWIPGWIFVINWFKKKRHNSVVWPFWGKKERRVLRLARSLEKTLSMKRTTRRNDWKCTFRAVLSSPWDLLTDMFAGFLSCGCQDIQNLHTLKTTFPTTREFYHLHIHDNQRFREARKMTEVWLMIVRKSWSTDQD